METFDRFDVVVVPFPFVAAPVVKRRPALCLVSAAFVMAHEQAVLAMITSAKHSQWPSDLPLDELQPAGLTTSSVVRWKLFTLPAALVERRLGRLGPADMSAVKKAVQRLLLP